MSRDTRRYLGIILLLLAGIAIAGVFASRPFSAGETPDRAHTFVTDIDNWRQTDQWRRVYTPYDFHLGPNLAALPLSLGRWAGQDIPQTNLEVFILLEPEEYVYRRYADDAGHILWLSMIGSRKSKSFHPPQICYSADGWTTEVSAGRIPLEKGDLYSLHVDAEKGAQRHLVLYFYLWPDERRDPAQGTVLFKVTVPFSGRVQDEEAAFALAQDFIGTIFMRGERP